MVCKGNSNCHRAAPKKQAVTLSVIDSMAFSRGSSSKPGRSCTIILNCCGMAASTEAASEDEDTMSEEHRQRSV